MRSSRALTRATRSSKALLPAAEPMEVTFTYDGVSQVAIPWEPKSLAKVARQVKDVELLCGLRERLQTWKAHRDEFIKTPLPGPFLPCLDPLFSSLIPFILP